MAKNQKNDNPLIIILLVFVLIFGTVLLVGKRNLKFKIMPWNEKDYPPSMKNLDKKVRNKAIEIANALVEKENMEEGRAIPIAISRAKEWADNH